MVHLPSLLLIYSVTQSRWKFIFTCFCENLYILIIREHCIVKQSNLNCLVTQRPHVYAPVVKNVPPPTPDLISVNCYDLPYTYLHTKFQKN